MNSEIGAIRESYRANPTVIQIHRCRGRGDKNNHRTKYLSTETVQGATAALQCVDDVEGSDGFAFSVFSVGNRITDNVLQEDLQYATSLLVDEARDTFDTTTTSETTDSGFGDTLDVVAKNLTVALGAALSETFSTFSAARHCER